MGSTIHSLEAYGTIFEAYFGGDIQTERSATSQHLNGSTTHR